MQNPAFDFPKQPPASLPQFPLLAANLASHSDKPEGSPLITKE